MKNIWKKWAGTALGLALVLAAQVRADRVVRAEGMSLAPGQTNRVVISLEGLGNEKALGFNIGYDTNSLRYVRAQAGVDAIAAGASLTINPNQTTNFGRLGLVLSLNLFNSDTFPSGTNRIIDVYFTPAAGATAGVSAVVFTNAPGATEISDAEANALPATYVGTTVSIAIPCAFVLSTNTLNLTGAGGAVSFNLNANGAACEWMIENTNTWITVVSATNGIGSAAVNLSVDANPSVTVRSGIVLAGGQLLTVVQQGQPCGYALSATNVALGGLASTNSLDLTTVAGCAWTVENTNAWVTLLSSTSGSGPATITFSVPDYLSSGSRTGVVIVAGQLFTISQQGIECTYAVSPINATHGAGPATNSFDVLATVPCPWNVVNTNGWVTILSSASGSGNGLVTYSVAANESVAVRSGVISVNGATFQITQSGVTCLYVFSTNLSEHTAAAETNSVTLTTAAPCPWLVENTNSWISVITRTNGVGPGVVTYAVTANASVTPRVGSLLIGGQVLIVTQQAVNCTFALSSTNASAGSAGLTNSFNVLAAAPCAWTAVSSNSWIAIVSGATGTGNGTVTFAVEANASPLERTGIISVAGSTFTITQQGITCSFAVSPTRRTHGFGSASNSFSVTTSSGCPWTVVNTNGWISLTLSSGTGAGVVGYLVDANAGAERIGYLTVQGATLIITQRATTCSYTATPAATNFGFASATGAVAVTAGASCTWTATTTNNWINFVSPAAGTGSGNVSFGVDANWNASARTGAVQVAGQTVLVTQAAYTAGFSFRPLDLSTPGQVSFSLQGGPLGVWELQSSSDLSNWVTLSSVTNSTGRVDFSRQAPAGSNVFFRAIVP